MMSFVKFSREGKYIFVTLLILSVFTWWVFDVYYVASSSMEPTIPIGSVVVVNKAAYIFSSIERNDIVAFVSDDELFHKGPWTHRVVAIAGDVVAVSGNQLMVNGTAVNYGDQRSGFLKKDLLPIVVGKNLVFQKGDGANTQYGVASTDLVFGRVVASVLPNGTLLFHK